MTWIDFPLYSSIIVILWTIGLLFLLISYKKESVLKVATLLFLAGWEVLIFFIVELWESQEHHYKHSTTEHLDHFRIQSAPMMEEYAQVYKGFKTF